MLCFFSIVIENYHISIVLNIVINITVSTIFIELFIIVLFVIKILNPTSFEKASNEIVNKISNRETGVKGSLEEFLTYYNHIEQILEKYGREYIPLQYSEVFTNKINPISKAKLTNILYKSDKINSDIKEKILNIISFRNSLIHGTELSVTVEDINKVKEILSILQKALNVK